MMISEKNDDISTGYRNPFTRNGHIRCPLAARHDRHGLRLFGIIDWLSDRSLDVETD